MQTIIKSIMLVLAISISFGCTVEHGINRIESNYTKMMAEDHIKISMIGTSVMHDGNFTQNEYQKAMNSHTITASSDNYNGGTLVKHGVSVSSETNVGAVGWLMGLNKPSDKQLIYMAEFEDRVRAFIQDRFKHEVDSFINFQPSEKQVAWPGRENIRQFILTEKLSGCFYVYYHLTRVPDGLFGEKYVVRGHYTLFGPEGKIKLEINTKNMLPEGMKIQDTRDIEHQEHYFKAIEESLTDFAVFFEEALHPETEDK
ncbi:hypothetical protein JD969_06050 [Planctomycetota bacterium]|nr:hypothetical protein JD969_06050 [Planctomycetota bacterium]